jgi:tetratricopeptide (TPR) repeat protein
VKMLNSSATQNSEQTQIYRVKCLGELGLVVGLQHHMEEALTIRQQQIAIARRMLALHPDSNEWQDLLFNSLQDLSLTHLNLNANQAATLSAKEGVALARQIVEQRPNSGEAEYRLHESLGLLGTALMHLDDLAGSQKCFNESLQILVGLSATNPNLFDVNYEFIQMLIWKGENAQDATYFQKALEIALAMQQRGILPAQYADMIDSLKKRLDDQRHQH